MIKNLKEKIGVVSGIVVTNSLTALEANKVMVGVNLALNVMGHKDLVTGVKQTIKHVTVASLVGGVVTTALQKDTIMEAIKGLDIEETEEVMEGEE